jgi:hypothetical protein
MPFPCYHNIPPRVNVKAQIYYTQKEDRITFKFVKLDIEVTYWVLLCFLFRGFPLYSCGTASQDISIT